MARNFLYRISSGEVVATTTDARPFPGADTDYFAMVADPQAPDGFALAPRKIWTGAVMRNATQNEIADILEKEAIDGRAMQRDKAKSTLAGAEPSGKAMLGIVGLMVIELNRIRTHVGLPDLVHDKVVEDLEAFIQLGSFEKP